MELYLASPLGFAASTRAYMDEMEAAFASATPAIAVRNPWRDDTLRGAMASAYATADPAARIAAIAAVNRQIAARNEAAIRACPVLVAVLDGVDVDSGTASEIGFAAALGKRLYGLRTDGRQAGDNAGAIVNLQVQYWIEASGGAIVTRLDALLALLTR